VPDCPLTRVKGSVHNPTPKPRGFGNIISMDEVQRVRERYEDTNKLVHRYKNFRSFYNDTNLFSFIQVARIFISVAEA
jgi:hypothetical protein